MNVDDEHAECVRILLEVSLSTGNTIADKPFLMSSPLISFWRSRVKLFGATYSAAAVLIALEMNPEINGMFITFGRCSLKGTTLIVMWGRPSNVTIVVFTL